MNSMAAAAWIERQIARTPDGTCIFFDTNTFPWVKDIEAHWLSIRKELDALLEHKEEIPNLQDVSPEQSQIARGESWKSFFLYGFGHKIEANCARCPETARIVKSIPGLKMAMFSILAGKSHIPAHRGPYRGLLRYHLGLLIPKPSSSCRIRVADEIRSWEQGRSLIFDDSFDHEAWNDADSDRVILFVDFVRPLPFPLSTLNRMAIWHVSRLPFVVDAVRRLRSNKVKQYSCS